MKVIGLMSGTSVDGIDAALVEISGAPLSLKVELLAGKTYSYPEFLRQKVLAACASEPLSIANLADLDDAIANQFAQAAIQIQQGFSPAELIGSHGQTVFHRPPILDPASPRNSSTLQHLGYSLQLGRGDLIAWLTGITTVSNFRAADIAAGGQGAPLVPAIDRVLLRHPTRNRCIQNIGGIGNVAYLPAASASNSISEICGWDTGPGNVLIDLAVQQFSSGQQRYDTDGAWATQGKPCRPLVDYWLQQDFFRVPPPKSTGRELFGLDYLQQCLNDAVPYSLSQADILATLTELTAASIALSYNQFLPQLPDEVLLCGGGSHNAYLKQRLQANLKSVSIITTDQLNLNADYKEAIAFAVLAYWRIQGIPGNVPEVTGAQQAVPLGEIHIAATPSHQ